MINLPRFNFGSNAKGELSVKDVETVAVNQIRYVQPSACIGGTLQAPAPDSLLAWSHAFQTWRTRGGSSVAAPMMPEIKAPSVQTQEAKLEDRGQAVSRFRSEVRPCVSGMPDCRSHSSDVVHACVLLYARCSHCVSS